MARQVANSEANSEKRAPSAMRAPVRVPYAVFLLVPLLRLFALTLLDCLCRAFHCMRRNQQLDPTITDQLSVLNRVCHRVRTPCLSPLWHNEGHARWRRVFRSRLHTCSYLVLSGEHRMAYCIRTVFETPRQHCCSDGVSDGKRNIKSPAMLQVLTGALGPPVDEGHWP